MENFNENHKLLTQFLSQFKQSNNIDIKENIDKIENGQSFNNTKEEVFIKMFN